MRATKDHHGATTTPSRLWLMVYIIIVLACGAIRSAPQQPADDVEAQRQQQLTHDDDHHPPVDVVDADDDDDAPVKYNGDQLWRIPFDALHERNAVAELQNNFNVAVWRANGTSVDMLLKRPELSGAGRLMSDANVTYAVLIADLQREIEAENPPAAVIQQLQNRKARSTDPKSSLLSSSSAATSPASSSWPDTWPQFMSRPVSRSDMARMHGAMMGYNVLETPMALWPEAKWGHRMTWGAYHRTSDIHGYIDYLAQTYPELCSVQSIGNSKEGRPLKLLRISNGNPSNPAIWLDGGIHAREWISPAAVTYIVDQFAEDWEAQPAYVRNIDWYVLPVANPDGYEYTHTTDRLWRKNRGGTRRGRCAGVDLNRNFGYRWGGQGASQQPCSEIFAGTKAWSEPETLAQKRFMEKTAANFRGFLTFHSYGQYILYPWGYDRAVPPDYKDLDRVGQDAAKHMRKLDGKQYKVGASGTLLYPAAGASDDWAKSLGIKYSYTVELRDSGRYGFVLPASEIERTALEAMEMVRAVARAVDAEKGK